MKILADHCVPEGVIQALRREGVEVVRVVDLVDPRATDKNVATLAAHQGAILLTADTDFQHRKDFTPRRFSGIVLLKDLHAAPERVLRRLLRLVAGDQEALFGTLTILDRRSARVRR